MYIRTDGLEDASLSHSANATLASGLGPDFKTLVNASFALTTVGQFALLLLCATVLLCHNIYKRSAALVNLLIISFVGTFPPYFLMYGGVMWDSIPPVALCVTQAALTDGTRTMLAVAPLALVVDLIVEIRIIRQSALIDRIRQPVVIAAPYIAFLGFSISAAVLGTADPAQVAHAPGQLACSLRDTSYSIAMQIIMVLSLLTALCLEVYAIVDALRARHKLSELPRSSLLSFSQAVRIVAFTCLQASFLIVTALDLYLQSPDLHAAFIVYQALTPLGTFLIFSMTQDCIDVWRSWVSNLSRLRRTDKQVPGQSPVEVKVTVEKFGDYPMGPFHIQLEPST